MSTTASQLPWDGVSATDASVLTRSQARRVILASSLGTLFEWYDFFIYGSLAAFFGTLFFPKGSETAAFLASLAAFGAGFAVRPLGGLLFGILGDTLGRKLSFLTTIVLMGASTAAIGFLPTFQTWGWAAPAALVGLRLLQGLALGGEYGGAAIYVAEHAPDHRRGTWTSWISNDGEPRFVGFTARRPDLPLVFDCRAICPMGLANPVRALARVAGGVVLRPDEAY